LYAQQQILFKLKDLMKIFTYILITIATLLSIYNATKLDFANLLQGDSLVALISIVASLCAVLILLIFMTSKKIEDKVNNKK
jgi:hypothetical protein